MSKTVIPTGYTVRLGSYDTQAAIGTLRSTFQQNLGEALNLKRVSAPLFVDPKSGLNDDLNGVERPVTFDVKETGKDAVVVHSLAKWKRMALKKYGFPVGEGLYTDMNAIRRDEEMDNLHSIYVDQWDWEKVIAKEDRTIDYLKETVKKIVGAVCDTQEKIKSLFPALKTTLSREITFITTQELEDLYPDLAPKAREEAFMRAGHPTVFLMQIGDKLKSGIAHDGRAPDYDDWALNGDIIFWNEVLSCPFEVSSMGIRVSPESLAEQLKKAGCEERAKLPFHAQLLAGDLPYTMGGGIGQSRMCTLLLEKCHVGEVQVSLWDEETEKVCKAAGVPLL
ncbi:MAG: aspartate--ammonia ligase [Clostridia bacterium]|nr:aspartate--ammonia ligase [Clostridia bacterium]